jgi:hypothetical protein
MFVGSSLDFSHILVNHSKLPAGMNRLKTGLAGQALQVMLA